MRGTNRCKKFRMLARGRQKVIKTKRVRCTTKKEETMNLDMRRDDIFDTL